MAGKREGLAHSKGHIFKAQTILKPAKCQHCGKFIWGWGKGYVCKNCKAMVHKSCIGLVNECTAEGALLISGPREGTLRHVRGVKHDKIGKMVHIDNLEKFKEDPVMQRLFASAGIDPNHLGPGAMDFAVKFAQEQKLFEFYNAVVPPERREKHRKRAQTNAAPPPPPPPPPPKTSTPTLVVKPRPAAEEKSEKDGGILEELGLERGRDEPLSLVEELKRGTVTLRRVQPDFERKTVQNNDLHGMLGDALAGFRANLEFSSDEEDDYSDEEWAETIRKRSQGAIKLGAIVEAAVDKNKEEKAVREEEEQEEEYCSPLYQAYMAKLLKNGGHCAEGDKESKVDSGQQLPDEQQNGSKKVIQDENVEKAKTSAQTEEENGDSRENGEKVQTSKKANKENEANQEKEEKTKGTFEKEKEVKKTVETKETKDANPKGDSSTSGTRAKNSALENLTKESRGSRRLSVRELVGKVDEIELNKCERRDSIKDGKTFTGSKAKQMKGEEVSVSETKRKDCDINVGTGSGNPKTGNGEKSKLENSQMGRSTNDGEVKTDAIAQQLIEEDQKKTPTFEGKSKLSNHENSKFIKEENSNSSIAEDSKVKMTSSQTNNEGTRVEESNNVGSPINFRASLRPPKGQRVI